MSAEKNLFGKDNPGLPFDMFNYILGFLPLADRVRSRLVSRAWSNEVIRSPLWKQAANHGSKDIDDFIQRFKLLHPYLKKLMHWGGCDLEVAEHITQVWQNYNNYIDHLPQAIRDKLLDPNYPHQNLSQNYMAFALIRSGLIDVDEARVVSAAVLNCFLKDSNFGGNEFNQTYGICALSKKLITLKQAALISEDKLAILFKKEGVKALENGWIKISDVAGASVECLRLFLGTVNYYGAFNHINNEAIVQNMALIKEGVISFKAVSELSDQSLSLLLSPIGHQMLREKLINIDQLKALPNSQYAEVLLGAWGKFALSNGLVTIEEFGQLANEGYAKAILTEWGCIALRDGYVNLNQIKAMPNAPYAAALLKKWGVEAVKVGFVTPEQIQGLPDVRYASALLSEWGFEAMSEGLITIDMLNQIPHPEHLEKILSKNGLKALRKGLIKIDNLSDEDLNMNTLAYLLGDGFEAMEKGIVRVDDVIHSDEYSVRLQAQNIKVAIDNLSNYQAVLSALSSNKISSKNNKLGVEKAGLLQKYFPDNSKNITTEELTVILENKKDPLLVNRSKFHFKFFKIKSAIKGYKNPLLKNRLCESETEVRLVQLYKACAAA